MEIISEKDKSSDDVFREVRCTRQNLNPVDELRPLVLKDLGERARSLVGAPGSRFPIPGVRLLRDEDPQERGEVPLSSVYSRPISRCRRGKRSRRGSHDERVRAEPVALGRHVLHAAAALGGAPLPRG